MTDTERSQLFAEVLAALIIIAGLFIGSLGIFDAARSADFRPGLMPACHDRNQLTHKAVLRCRKRTE